MMSKIWFLQKSWFNLFELVQNIPLCSLQANKICIINNFTQLSYFIQNHLFNLFPSKNSPKTYVAHHWWTTVWCLLCARRGRGHSLNTRHSFTTERQEMGFHSACTTSRSTIALYSETEILCPLSKLVGSPGIISFQH